MKYTLGLNKTLVRLKLICRKWMVFVSLWEHRRDSVGVTISSSANINVQVSAIQSLLLLSDEERNVVLCNSELLFGTEMGRLQNTFGASRWMYRGCSLVVEEGTVSWGFPECCTPALLHWHPWMPLGLSTHESQSKMWFIERPLCAVCFSLLFLQVEAGWWESLPWEDVLW